MYSNINFIDENTAASVYLNPYREIKRHQIDAPLFPFGCNASQELAVRTALSNQISVIQGPPGTGKTQTILNIIANRVMAKKSVLIVSGTNSAIENVLEKLNENSFGFFVASLGNREKKEAFIQNQPPLNPELPSWRKNAMELYNLSTKIKTNLEKIKTIFKMQERLALCRQELAEVTVEMSHYKQAHSKICWDIEVKTSSAKIIRILREIKDYAIKYHETPHDLLRRIKRFFDTINLKLQLRSILDIKDELKPESTSEIIVLLEWLIYIKRIEELKSEIAEINNQLSQLDAKALMGSLTDDSMTMLKASIAQRYENGRDRIASVKDLFTNGKSVLEYYPVVLSTTFCARSCFNCDTIFDYVIMDEASQVSILTGWLALTCARNAVIVGDVMQLPNVITEIDRAKLVEIKNSYNIPASYDAGTHSFLRSILATIPNIPETLLREHYRCHPDIINFCNQKFYGGNLIIMTQRDDHENHLLALTTMTGHHCRQHYNQREIDAVKEELMPLLDNHTETGVIAPYNNQVNKFKEQIPDVQSDTVHKYQGREKETIIFSVTDDNITEFSDDANLLNVAVSRAKNKFCIVVRGNNQKLKGNIHDLLGYIKYQKGTIIQSKLRSIFDYLFSHVSEYDRTGKTISKYRSENLTFDLIERIRTNYPHLSHIKALHNYPIRYIIQDTSGLSERETRYALHPSTHIDFLIINRVTKEPLLAVETDGYSFHNEQTEQFHRDRLKDKILNFYGLPLVRLSTVGHGEEERIVDALNTQMK